MRKATRVSEYPISVHLRAMRSFKRSMFSSVLLSSIAGLSSLTLGGLTHCCALKFGFNEHVVVGSALIDMYFKCGAVEEAEMLFESLPEKNLVTWNALLSGYAHNGDTRKVFELFE